MQDTKNARTSDIIKNAIDSDGADKISLFEIRDALDGRGFSVLILMFSLPVSMPLPMPPGLTTIGALPLLIFSMQILLGHSLPWMPQWLGKKSFQRKKIANIMERASSLLKKVEKITKTRMSIFNNRFSERIYAFLVFICSISISLPIPFTNFIPGLGVVIMSFGMVNKDGLMVAIGSIISFIGLFVSSVVIISGPKLIMDMFDALF